MPYQRFDVKRPGDVGLIYEADSLPFDLPPNSWNAAYNVRFHNGDAESAKGWVKRATLSEPCKRIVYNAGLSGNYWLAFGTTKIFSIQDSLVETNVTRLSANYSSADWHCHNFQGIPIATNGVNYPQVQFEVGTAPDNSTKFQDHWIDPDGEDRCKLLIGYKNFIVALNITENGNNYPTKIRWSDAAAPGDIPASWDVADPTTLAGERVLPADTGAIVAAELMRDDLIIYMVNAVYRMTFVGGSIVMSTKRITKDFGAFGRNSVLNTRGGKHLVLTRDDLGWFDGNTFASLAKGRAKTTLQSFLTVAEAGSARIAYHSAMDEVWFAMVFPTNAGLFGIFNSIESASGAIAQRPAPYLVDFAELPDREITSKLVSSAYTWEEIAQLPSIDGWERLGAAKWLTFNVSGSKDDYYMMGLGSDGSIYRMDYGYEFTPYTEFESKLEKTDLDITGDENEATILAVYPRFSSGQIQQAHAVNTWDQIGLVGTYWDGSDGGEPDYSESEWWEFDDNRVVPQFYIGSQDAAGAPVNWREPKVLGSRYKVPTKARGRRHAFKIVSQGYQWRLSGYLMEFTNSGRKS